MLGLGIYSNIKLKPYLSHKASSSYASNIPREDNEHADQLSRLSRTSEGSWPAGVHVETRTQPCHLDITINTLGPEEDDWRTPFIKYLATGELPSDKIEKRRIAHQGLKYELVNGELYRKSFSGPLLICVG